MQSKKSIPLVIGVVIILYLFTPLLKGNGGKDNLAQKGEWAQTIKTMQSNEYHIAIIADLDKQSKDESGKKFKSWLKLGTLKHPTSGSWSIDWEGEPRTLVSKHNEAGRGMELSELVVYNDKLYTFDDRTGLVFEIHDNEKTTPVAMFIEGNGRGDKGQKSEWATVKDGLLYCGSFGKEYVGKNNEVTSLNNLWVATMDAQGKVAHENWTDKYTTMRKVTKSVHPNGYMIIETIVWSSVHRQWFVLPRRVSQQPYNEEEDERRGSNIILRCNEAITSCEQSTVGTLTPERGFSTAKFVPGTGDTIMVALKSEEKEAENTQATYITVFDIYGKTYLEETFVASNKYEGLEFI
eukprot:TRINITY_DN2217_c0_g1_i1.p1 TRINITY_DN2217_c0_g1~~TRINITY_DN2217_c0_g1_i1.p1  ORF type:complete len:351 (+),score=134.71 TRINITY_DN2217_c0_g1_i1:42-1094(+)